MHQVNPFHNDSANSTSHLGHSPDFLCLFFFSLQRVSEDQLEVQVPKVILAGRCSKSHRAVHRVGIWVCR